MWQVLDNDTSRTIKASQKYEEIFGAKPNLTDSNDPELMSILQKFIFSEEFFIGNLDDKTSELITVVVLTTEQTLPS